MFAGLGGGGGETSDTDVLDALRPSWALCLLVGAGPGPWGCVLWGSRAALFEPITLVPRFVTDCTFEDNSASDAGGAIHNHKDDVTVVNCTFNDNTAKSVSDRRAVPLPINPEPRA